jgi:hypothetical protein
MFMKLRDWIDSSKVNYNFLSKNSNAIEILLNLLSFLYNHYYIIPDIICLFFST